jgi:hypothetical protein
MKDRKRIFLSVKVKNKIYLTFQALPAILLFNVLVFLLECAFWKLRPGLSCSLLFLIAYMSTCFFAAAHHQMSVTPP